MGLGSDQGVDIAKALVAVLQAQLGRLLEQRLEVAPERRLEQPRRLLVVQVGPTRGLGCISCSH